MIRYDKKIKTYYNKYEQSYGEKLDSVVSLKLPSLAKKTTIDNCNISIVKNFNCGDLMYGLSTLRDPLYLKKWKTSIKIMFLISPLPKTTYGQEEGLEVLGQ
ncbi:hypothetical protein [Enterobacter roggenkampii]|uniref:hypothetical protein n=1 Tax=Enterobacter roggenkampii TaxID=1812935 RepID=UPI0012FF65E6|nr:hypothetical protein [Enterobacter roggenkampii]QWZ75365.1 hypothetical protein I6L60_23005 [Enterobacter roggenkampii]